MNNFNNKLKELRIKSSLTQSELGAKLDINPKVISKWENGESLPSCDLLPAIADVFNISIDALFDRIFKNEVDIKSIVRKFGYDHAYSIPDIQHLFSYMILGMQERDNVDMCCYTDEALREISDDLASLIENKDQRPQCHLINKEFGIVNYLCDDFHISTMTQCESENFDKLINSNYPKLRNLFGALSHDGADRLVKFFMNTNENKVFTLDQLIKETETEEQTARSFIDVMFELNNSSSELVIQKEKAILSGKETEIYSLYPCNQTNMLKTLLLSAVLLLKDKGGYR